MSRQRDSKRGVGHSSQMRHMLLLKPWRRGEGECVGQGKPMVRRARGEGLANLLQI